MQVNEDVLKLVMLVALVGLVIAMWPEVDD
jgi:hypothetical protein